MKTQATTSMHASSDKTPFAPTLTRALQAAIQADKLQGVLLSAGATKFRGSPFEVLEEVAASQTAAWIVGNPANPLAGPVPPARQPRIFEAAAETIDEDKLRAAAQTVGLHGANDVEQIRNYLAWTLAQTAFEATRFAEAENRPVCHNCVAVGGTQAVRVALQAPLSERIASAR